MGTSVPFIYLDSKYKYITDVPLSPRSEQDPEYSIEAARAGNLIGILEGQKDSSLFCVPPTRLAGPCRGVLTKVLKNMEAWT